MNQPEDKLVLRDFPVIQAIIGGGFLLAVLIMMTKPGGFWIGLLFCLVAIAIIGLMSFIVTVRLERSTRTLTLEQLSLLRRTYGEYSFDDLLSVNVESSGDNVYRLAIGLKNDLSVPFTSYYTSGYKSKAARAEKIRLFIGLTAPAAAPATPFQTFKQTLHPQFEGGEEGQTAGVSWRLQTAHLGALPITRWVSTDFKLAEGFLFLVQKSHGKMELPAKGLVGRISRLILEQSLKVYGFDAQDTPGIESTQLLETLDPRLEADYAALTSHPGIASQVLNPWVTLPLAQWAECHPLKTIQPSGEGQPGQLAVMFSPRGITLVSLQADPSGQSQSLEELGVELVRALR